MQQNAFSQNFQLFYKSMMQFKQQVFDKGPQFKNSSVIFLDFILNKLADAALQFNKQLESELRIQKEHLEDRSRRLEQEIKENKQQLTRQLTNKSEECASLELKSKALEKER
jgi:hypothetical protein